MGDLLMSLPAIHLLRQAFPRATVSLLLEKGLEPLLEGHPDIDQILKWDPKEGRGWGTIFRMARRLRKYHFDAAVILNPSRLFHVVSFLSAIPVRVGYNRKWGFLLTKSCADTKAIRSQHESEYNMEVVSLL